MKVHAFLKLGVYATCLSVYIMFSCTPPCLHSSAFINLRGRDPGVRADEVADEPQCQVRSWETQAADC